MSDNKVYYWLKLKADFFQMDEIAAIEAMPNGYRYINILLKMYLKSLRRDGKLVITEYIPYDQNILAHALRHDVDTVRSAIEVFRNFGLIEILYTGAIYMTQIQDFIGQSSTEADRKRAYRRKINAEKKADQKLLKRGQMSGQPSGNCPPEIETQQELKPKTTTRGSVVEKEVVSALGKHNITPVTAQRILKKYGLEAVKYQLGNLISQINKGAEIPNRSGWITSALKDNYIRLADELVTRKAIAAEKAKIIEIAQREALEAEVLDTEQDKPLAPEFEALLRRLGM